LFKTKNDSAAKSSFSFGHPIRQPLSGAVLSVDLPGHMLVHAVRCCATPGQGAPLLRVRRWTPRPHWLEHSDHWLHVDHLPFTATRERLC